VYRGNLRATLDVSVWKDVSTDFVRGKYIKEYIYWEEAHSVQKFQAMSSVS